MNPNALRCMTISVPMLFLQTTHAQPPAPASLKGGEQVYKEVCSACHGTGVAHAPKFQDKGAWAPLIAEGQDVLTGHAWVGVRAMPQRGGNPDLKLIEFARAVAYMASNAGGDWKEPDASMMRKIMKQAEERLETAIKEAQAMRKELHDQAKANR